MWTPAVPLGLCLLIFYITRSIGISSFVWFYSASCIQSVSPWYVLLPTLICWGKKAFTMKGRDWRGASAAPLQRFSEDILPALLGCSALTEQQPALYRGSKWVLELNGCIGSAERWCWHSHFWKNDFSHHCSYSRHCFSMWWRHFERSGWFGLLEYGFWFVWYNL